MTATTKNKTHYPLRQYLRPTLLGLEHATVEIPFPTGMLRIEMEQGKEPVITVPDGVTVEKSEGE